jgi:hypothetical protein
MGTASLIFAVLRVLNIRSAAGECLDLRSDQHAEAPTPATQAR